MCLQVPIVHALPVHQVRHLSNSVWALFVQMSKHTTLQQNERICNSSMHRHTQRKWECCAGCRDEVSKMGVNERIQLKDQAGKTFYVPKL